MKLGELLMGIQQTGVRAPSSDDSKEPVTLPLYIFKSLLFFPSISHIPHAHSQWIFKEYICSVNRIYPFPEAYSTHLS